MLLGIPFFLCFDYYVVYVRDTERKRWVGGRKEKKGKERKKNGEKKERHRGR